MATYQKLPSGSWRAQVRKAGLYRAATFPRKREAVQWATEVEAQAGHIATRGFAPPPAEATVADLIDRYIELTATTTAAGKTKAASLSMIRREIGHVKLA